MDWNQTTCNEDGKLKYSTVTVGLDQVKVEETGLPA